jgi:hypothetical protein
MKTIAMVLFATALICAQDKDSTSTFIDKELEGIRISKEQYEKEFIRLTHIENYLKDLKALGYEIKKDSTKVKTQLKAKEN